MSDQPDTTPDLDNLDIVHRPDGRMVLLHVAFSDGTTPCGSTPVEDAIAVNPPACPVCFAHLRQLVDSYSNEVVIDLAGRVLRTIPFTDPVGEESAPPRCRNCKHDADAHNRLGYCNGTPEDLQRPCTCPKWEPRNA